MRVGDTYCGVVSEGGCVSHLNRGNERANGLLVCPLTTDQP